MKPKPAIGYSATESIEEAITLLRRTPASTLLCSFVGGVPFWLALVYFVADMSRDAFAKERLAGGSLALAVLYLWKKCWQSVYTAGLHSQLAGTERPRWTLQRILRVIVTQAPAQFFGLLIRPLAYNFLFPTGWTIAFYQNVTVLGDGRDDEAPITGRAWAQARLWPGQNHALLGILSFFSFFVWLNVAITCAMLPFLVKTFVGWETMATREYGAFLKNTTFLMSVTAIAMLLIEPLWNAVYAVRCFHGTSVQTGADLRANLRAIRARASAFAVLLTLAFTSVAPAAMKTAPAPVSQVEPERLQHSIERTLERREFAWRTPREVPAGKEGVIDGWLKSIGRWIEKQWKSFWAWVDLIRKWIDETFFKKKPEASDGDGRGFSIPPMRAILYVAVAMVVVLLSWALFRYWRAPKKKTIVAEPVTPLPDLNRDDVHADELPEDGWMQMARDLMNRGELRLALRAAYLAGLAHLGQQQFVHIARHKSNLDYRRELRRRARTQAELLAAFDKNLLAFERAWYGDHGVTLPMFEEFTQNLERIRAC